MSVTVASRILVAVLLSLWAGEIPSAPTSAGPAVLGSKVTRCSAGGGSVEVLQGVHHVVADNAPLTIRVDDGRIASVLAKPLKITPSSARRQAPASLTIGAAEAAGGSLRFEVAMANLTDCTALVRAAHAVARLGGRPSRVASVRFGAEDNVSVPPGEKVTGVFVVPLEGDGTYQVTASTFNEIRLVR